MKLSAILAFAFVATASAFSPVRHAAIATPRAMPVRQALPEPVQEKAVELQDKAAKMPGHMVHTSSGSPSHQNRQNNHNYRRGGNNYRRN